MKIEIELPEIPGYEYTGEYREPQAFEIALVDGIPLIAQYWNGSHFILRHKGKPKIVIYQWLIKSNGSDPSDRGYRVINGTEDRIIALCSEYNWLYKKTSETPMFSLDGDFL